MGNNKLVYRYDRNFFKLRPSNQPNFLGESADVLQKVSLPITDRNTCLKAYNPLKVTLSKHQICAGGVDNKDSCGGDSGGPMMVPTLKSDGEAVYIQYVCYFV